MYHCQANSVQGFIQQLAVSYITHGYWFYVTGHIPWRKDPRKTDEKLIGKYDLDLSKWTRARRKKAGMANVQYLRRNQFFVLLATPGKHLFFQSEVGIQDIRRKPIHFAGYSVGCRLGQDGHYHASVRIEREEFRSLVQDFERMARFASVADLTACFWALPYAPYAPIRRQLLLLLRRVNAKRKVAGHELVTASALRLKRRPVSPFRKPPSTGLRQNYGGDTPVWFSGNP